MFGKSLRGLAAALLLGTATVAATSLITATAAEAAVRPAVGKPLQQAVELAKEGKGSAASAKVHEAESVGGLTGDEQRAIQQTKEFVAVKTGAGGGSLGAKAKFANDYNAGRYRDVVGEDADALRKAGGFDENSRLIVAQAYYLMGDNKAALRTLESLGDSSSALELKLAVANKLGDSQAQGDAARALVIRGQTKFWVYLLSAADHSGNLSDDDTLNIFRLRLLTGNMRSGEDYSTAAQIALQLGYPQEAVGFQQKGIDGKAFAATDMARQQRLLDLAKKQAADQSAHMDALAKAAAAAPTGDDLVHLSGVYWGIGKYSEALKAAQDGVAKGKLKDAKRGFMAEGMALTGLKRGGEASKAFKQAEADPKTKAVPDLWDVYAHTH